MVVDRRDESSPVFVRASKMKSFTVFACLFLLCAGQEDARQPKFFFGHKPNTVVNYRQISEIVTEFIPSSCIVLDPSLPPCRHVRNLEIYPSSPTRIVKTKSPDLTNLENGQRYKNPVAPQPSQPFNKAPTPPLRSKPQNIKTHSHFWAWNLFNPFRVQNVTHTETKTQYVTVKVEDPHTVVSFYVKGCRPSRLPFELAECYQPEPVVFQENKNIVVMAPLKFVPPFEKIATPAYKGTEKPIEKNLTKAEEEGIKLAPEYQSTERVQSQTETEDGESTETVETGEGKSYDDFPTQSEMGELEMIEGI